MAYKSSPRPVFDGPTPIPYAKVTRHIWGDVAAGQVGRLFRVFRVITHMRISIDQLPLKHENPALPALFWLIALYPVIETFSIGFGFGVSAFS